MNMQDDQRPTRRCRVPFLGTILSLVLLSVTLFSAIAAPVTEPLVHQCRWRSGQWNHLMGGSSIEVMEGVFKNWSDEIDTRFVNLSDSPAKAKGPTADFLTVCNETG